MLEYLIISLATAFCVFGNVQNNRKVMLLCGVLCAASFAVFWHLEGEMTAMGITLAAMTGTLIQLVTPDRLLQKTYWPRFIVTLALAAGVFASTFHGVEDALPMLGFTVARFAETFSRPQFIRSGYQFSGAMWLSFAAMTGNTAGIVSNIVILSAQSYALLRDFGGLARLRLALVPVKRDA